MAGFRSRRESLILRSGATTHPSARNPQHSRFFGVGFGRRIAETRSPCRHTCGRSIKCEAMDGRCRYLFIIEGGEEEGDEGRVGVLGLRRRWSWQVNRSWKRSQPWLTLIFAFRGTKKGGGGYSRGLVERRRQRIMCSVFLSYYILALHCLVKTRRGGPSSWMLLSQCHI